MTYPNLYPTCLCVHKMNASGQILAVNTTGCHMHGPRGIGPSIMPPWLGGAPRPGILERFAVEGERLLAAAGIQAHCVAGLEDAPGEVRVHALAELPGAVHVAWRESLQRIAPVYLSVYTSCRYAERETTVRLDYPKAHAARDELVALATPAEACGHCGMREVRARRCGYCGGRG